MKWLNLTVAAFLLILFQINANFAQEINGIPTGPIPKLKIAKNISSENLAFYSATIAFGYSSQQEASLSMPIPSGNPLTILSPYTFTGFASSMCLGGNGKYYLIEYYFMPPVPDPSLYEFNPINGEISLTGSITGLGTSIPSGIAYNPYDGGYYICTHDALYSFDLNTRVATFIGSFGLTSGYMDDLCFNESGICYAIAIGSAQAFTINTTTGVATLLGSLGYYAIYGHGMSYDFETSTIYISAYNHTPQTGQLRTMDPLTGNTTLITDWGWEQIAPFAVNTYYGPPCPVGSPFNPNPANGSTGVSVINTSLNWTNGTGTSDVEVWFGTAGSVTKVYDGVEISTWELDTLNFSTTYNWKVICKNDTCSSTGPYWSFLTESDSTVIFYEPFNNLNCWTPIGPSGFGNWIITNTNFAEGSPPSELILDGWNPVFNGLSQLLSSTIIDDSYHYIVKFRHKVDLYSSGGNSYKVGLAVTYDGGLTKEIIWQTPLTGNFGPEEIETELYPASNTFQLILYYNGLPSMVLDFWYVDDLILIDDCMECFPPAGPTNLGSQHFYNPHRVLLYWQDNSWNEEGFKVFRKNGFPNDTTQYQLIGTVTQNHHNFWDYNIIIDSTYTYRVMAFNQYGNSDTSVTTTITIPIPVELLSFTATAVGEKVILNWSTATELNNLGFEIERRSETEYYTIGFVKGFGTTTEIQNYSYSDFNAEKGFNYYRLKQIDFNGKSTYSEEIEIDFTGPVFFSLEQNYPNPFNPSTNIEFNLVVDSKVSLKIYDVLGQEITQLVNSSLTAGNHNFDFNASYLNSGIYFYKLEAIGKDGTNFTAVKKMILAK